MCDRNIARAWCKTIVTTSFYIRSYNSFAPSPQLVDFYYIQQYMYKNFMFSHCILHRRFLWEICYVHAYLFIWNLWISMWICMCCAKKVVQVYVKWCIGLKKFFLMNLFNVNMFCVTKVVYRKCMWSDVMAL